MYTRGEREREREREREERNGKLIRSDLVYIFSSTNLLYMIIMMISREEVKY
jgi:hypothetical protein